jgi:hypothetical protein
MDEKKLKHMSSSNEPSHHDEEPVNSNPQIELVLQPITTAPSKSSTDESKDADKASSNQVKQHEATAAKEAQSPAMMVLVPVDGLVSESGEPVYVLKPAASVG